MYSKTIFLFIFLFSICGFSQVKDPDAIDFFEFTTPDFQYQVMIVMAKADSDQKTETTVRVLYDDRIVEFYSITEFEVIDNAIFISINPKGTNVKVIQGETNYNPDTFLLVMDIEGNFVKGEATDKNSTTGNKLTYPEVLTFTQKLNNLKKFYNSDDPLYSKLVKILKDEFITK